MGVKGKIDLTMYAVFIHLFLGGHSNEFINLIFHPTLKNFDLLQDQAVFDHVVNHIASVVSSRRSRGRCEGRVWRTTVDQRTSESMVNDQQGRGLKIRKHEVMLQ